MTVPPKKRRRVSESYDQKTQEARTSSEDLDSGKGLLLWNLEQQYEQQPRRLADQLRGTAKLPIKTAEGWVQQPRALTPLTESDQASVAPSNVQDEATATDESSAALGPRIPQQESVRQAKEELAKLAGLISEDPEENVGSLKALSDITSSSNDTIAKLALVSQLAVFKDIIPGYRIRPGLEGDGNVKLSKEVRRLRTFERGLLAAYGEYVGRLTKLAGGNRSEPSGQPWDGMPSKATVAINCACNLLASVPHFNLRNELILILVKKMSEKVPDEAFVRCRNTLETLFREDDEGYASLEAVAVLTKMVKSKKFRVDESVLNTFLHLRLLREFAFKGSNATIDKTEEIPRKKGKKVREKREFRTKRQRKLIKENKAIEKEMSEAAAMVSAEERDRIQGEILKLVFATYFRILKARTPELIGAVLEGLASYAHLANQDFFADILEVLKEIISDHERDRKILDEDGAAESIGTSRNTSRESLLCVATAFALLHGQDASRAAASLKLDLSFFVTHLYRALLPLSLDTDVELSSKSLHLPEPPTAQSKLGSQITTNRVNVQRVIVLLLRSLRSVCTPPTAAKNVSPVRVAAFSKQIFISSLHLPDRSCVAMMGLMQEIVKVHGRRIDALWFTEERRGDGIYDPLKGEIESSNPFASTVWETELLRKHFCPSVRDSLTEMDKKIVAAR